MTAILNLLITISMVLILVGVTILLLLLMAWAAILIFQMIKEERKDVTNETD